MGDFQILHRWRTWLRGQGASDDTVRLYTIGVHRLLTEYTCDGPHAVTPEHIDDFFAGLGHRAVARVHYYRGIRSLMKFCLARDIITKDPSLLSKPQKPRKRPRVAYTGPELEAVLAAAWQRAPRRRWTLQLTYGVGGRRREIAGLKPDDIQGEEVVLFGKGRRERRVPIGEAARQALEQLRPTWNGTVVGVGPGTITEWAHQAAKDAGLLPKVRNRSAHILRASFITHLLNAGVPPQVVRDLAGHENMATTNEYAAVFDEHKERAVAHLWSGGLPEEQGGLAGTLTA